MQYNHAPSGILILGLMPKYAADGRARGGSIDEGLQRAVHCFGIILIHGGGQTDAKKGI
jgi:hypothetical protein